MGENETSDLDPRMKIMEMVDIQGIVVSIATESIPEIESWQCTGCQHAFAIRSLPYFDYSFPCPKCGAHNSDIMVNRKESYYGTRLVVRIRQDELNVFCLMDHPDPLPDIGVYIGDTVALRAVLVYEDADSEIKVVRASKISRISAMESDGKECTRCGAKDRHVTVIGRPYCNACGNGYPDNYPYRYSERHMGK